MKNISNYYPICTKCCHVNEWGYYFENICNDLQSSSCSKCQNKVVLIDSLFKPIAEKLWSKNYMTQNCCLGHPEDYHSSLPYISFNKVHDFESIPSNWSIDNPFCSIKTVLRCNDKTNINYDELIKWAKELPQLQKEEKYSVSKFVLNKEYNSKLIYFLGKNSLSKNLHLLTEEYVWVDKMTDIKDINRIKNNVIIDASLLFDFVLDLESNFLVSENRDKKVIVCFSLKDSLEANCVPTGINGWGVFENKKQYGLYNLWKVKYKPKILTGNEHNIFNVYY